MTVALILAAGRSSRMGRAKAFLPHREPGITFVGHLLSSAAASGVDSIHVVGRVEDTALRKAAVEAGAGYIENPHPDRGPLSSIIAGLDRMPDDRTKAILLLPVDIPLVTAGVIRAVLMAAEGSTKPIVRTSYRGRHGHPVLFKRALFGELRQADPAIGARAVVRADAARVLDLDVDDAGVLEDVDTPEDYERLFGRPLP